MGILIYFLSDDKPALFVTCICIINTNKAARNTWIF